MSNTANRHKPWLEPTYHGIVTENDNAVLLDPPLIALDKDAPLRFAGRSGGALVAPDRAMLWELAHPFLPGAMGMAEGGVAPGTILSPSL